MCSSIRSWGIFREVRGKLTQLEKIYKYTIRVAKTTPLTTPHFTYPVPSRNLSCTEEMHEGGTCRGGREERRGGREGRRGGRGGGGRRGGGRGGRRGGGRGGRRGGGRGENSDDFHS